MPLDPQAAVLLETMAKMNAGRPLLHEGTPEEARVAYAANIPPTPDEPLASVEDRTIPGPAGPLRLRVYRPLGEGALPAVVYCHGGGWVMGSIESHNALCHSLASRSGCVVAAVDYRLAPEDPFPAGLDDCVAAVQWVVDNAGDLGVDPGRVAVGGDSSGGNLAAAACLVARDRGGPPIAFQLLIYPVLAFGYDTPSYAENAEGYFLTEVAMRWFSDQYLGRPEDATDPYAAPLLATDLAGLPPAHMVTAEFDPLRDEDEAYVDVLAAAGVPAGLHRYEGMIHGFVRMAGALDQGKAALDECAAVLRQVLRPGEARLSSASGVDTAGTG
jgi:acetyl esterase